MNRDEMLKIAEGIARDPKSYPSARVSALRFVKELGETRHEDDVASSFADLDELSPRRRNRAKK
jgi:hypothetical protein